MKTLQQRLGLIESIDFSHSVFMLHLEHESMAKMSEQQFLTMLKLIEVYRADCILLMGLSNTPYKNKLAQNEL